MDWQLKKAQRIRIGLVLIAGLLYLSWIRHPISAYEATRATEEWTGAMAGNITGHFDGMTGKYEIHGYGLSVTPPEYGELLRQRYGIKYQEMGCVVSYYALAYEASYGKVMDRNLRKKFGRDVLAETYRDAKELNHQRRAARHQ